MPWSRQEVRTEDQGGVGGTHHTIVPMRAWGEGGEVENGSRIRIGFNFLFGTISFLYGPISCSERFHLEPFFELIK